jgi:hypothetical protein
VTCDGVAKDDRERELEIVAVVLTTGDLLIKHVMPTELRKRGR